MEVGNVCVACNKEVDMDNCVIAVVNGVGIALHTQCYIATVMQEIMQYAAMQSIPTGSVAH